VFQDRSASYERVLRERSGIIRDLEKRNFNIRRGERSMFLELSLSLCAHFTFSGMQMFRDALITLQRQVDALDDMKAEHYEQIIEHEEEVWDVVQGKVCLLVRSTMDVFDRFTAKASDPILEPMLQSVPDPFDAYGTPSSEDQIFSILPPLSIMAPSPSPSTQSSAELASGTSYTAASWARDGHIGADAQYASGSSMEWADTSPPPVSPPTIPSPPRSPSPSRRSASGARSTSPRAEAKLRSVLAVIDESRGRQLASASVDEESEDESGPVRNGWTSFPFAEHPRAATGGSSKDVTPRGSAFFPEDGGGGERSHTPTATEVAVG